MVFSSLLFVFLFFTITMIVYSLTYTLEGKNRTLLVASLIFYAWGGPKYLILLLFMAFTAWLTALKLEEHPKGTASRKRWLIIGIVIQLGLLGYFKYAMLLLNTLQAITSFPQNIPQIVLPIGISFYTFQLLSYDIDVYRGDVKAQKKYWLILLYCSLFHQCIAGPIVRYSDVEREITGRKVKLKEIGRGINRFTIGLFKKAVMANFCAVIADRFLEGSISELRAVPALGIWFGAFMFTLQIYLDFSAYSDMAIGMGLMVGFHYKENFNHPYISDSVTEFWRRWHISLSTFFRDYVYIPLGGNRVSVRRNIINLFIVWGLTGLWHGASWNFVLWGLYYFVFLILEKFVLKDKLEHIPEILRILLTFLIVVFGWIIFKFTTFDKMLTAIAGLFGLNHNGFTNMTISTVFMNNIFMIIFCMIGCTPFAVRVYKIICKMAKRNLIFKHIRRVLEVAGPVVLLLLSVMALVGNSYNPFLYFQF